ncbi:MAG TPA: hypothetical protein VFC00_22805 [Micromonosporaceae bacterium]|nr:hypothetical protein [Micromonosporaceae bacterium]
MAKAGDEQAPPVVNVARSPGATPRRLTATVEIVRVKGPDAAHLAEVQLDAIKEVLTWTLADREHTEHVEDRAA